MALSMNKVQLIGNLGDDPQIATMHNGDAVANLRVATTESWMDKNSGEWKDRTVWHNVVVYNERLIDRIRERARKGRRVYVEGQINNYQYEKEGQTRYGTEVAVQRFRGDFQFVDNEGNRGENDGDRQAGDRGGRDSRNSSGNNRGGHDAGNGNGRGGYGGQDDRRGNGFGGGGGDWEDLGDPPF